MPRALRPRQDRWSARSWRVLVGAEVDQAAAGGRPLRNERLGETLLPKKLALPVFCSDPLSSNAYATEEILRALSLGGLALLHPDPVGGARVVVLLVVVVASYRQTCHAYPSGVARMR